MTIPYLFRLGARIQRGLEQLPDDFCERHQRFFLSRQLPQGGFSGRDVDLEGAPLFEDGVQADLYYTSFAVRGLAALGAFDAETAARVAQWLRPAAGRSGSVIDVVSWLYSALVVQTACGIDLLADAAPDWPDQLARVFESFRTHDGGYAKTSAGTAGSTYHSFLVALCYELIGCTLPDADRLVQFVLERQRDDGGFVEVGQMRRSGTNPTAAAIALLTMFEALDQTTRERTISFLNEVRGDDGGFQANTRVPFSDTLSTFTGYLTCLDLGCANILSEAKLQRFLRELDLSEGGFLAAGWDRVADVEYTFYALGTLGLLHDQKSPH
ncbi:MAG: geranyl transferase [Planctomycetales bacterium 12-60-4]|nr:MAG: geranyl transferase [Planctomycetales bacterium 12-60-4]